MTVNVTRPDIRSVSTSKSTKEVVTHTQVPTVVVADVGQAGPRGGVGNTGGKGDTGDRGLQGDSGIFVGNAPPSIDTILWADTTTAGDDDVSGASSGSGIPGDPIVIAPVKWLWNSTFSGNGILGSARGFPGDPTGNILSATDSVFGDLNGAMPTPIAIDDWFSTFDPAAKHIPGYCVPLGSPENVTIGLQVGDRIAVNDWYNWGLSGVYTITSLGSVSTPWVLTRATDLNLVNSYKEWTTTLENTNGNVVSLRGFAENHDYSVYPTTDLGRWSKYDMSVASGYTAVASALGSIASGYISIASGDYSVASGDYSNASGYNSIASGSGSISSGYYSNASGSGSIASGSGSVASGDYSVASGNGSTASGNGSTASGRYSNASGSGSIASGNGSVASGDYSVASGNSSTASGNSSVASGNSSTASGLMTSALACNSIAATDYSTNTVANTTT